MSGEDEARERLRGRYDRYGGKRCDDVSSHPLITDADAVTAVGTAVWGRKFYTADGAGKRDQGFCTPERIARRHDSYPEPTRDDILDALLNVPAARSSLDRDVLRLIDAARAAGVGWDEVGEALGYYPPRSAKSAQALRSSLARSTRYPRRYGRRRPTAVGDGHAHTLGMPCPVAACRWPLPTDTATDQEGADT